MSAALRYLAILTLILAAARGFAQESTATTTGTTEKTETTATTTTAATTTVAEEAEKPQPASREQFRQFVTEHYAEELATVLALEPALLTNEEFLQGHPDLAEFVKAHPEVGQHASSYAAQLPRAPQQRRSTMEAMIESLSIAVTFAALAWALAWVVRTIIEQKRWSRLAKTQAEVHNKILDRFGNTEELMQYIKTPTGAKFLESAPIPLHIEPRATPQPYNRVMLSIQAGVVIAAGALGMLVVAGRFARDTGDDLFALGMIGFSIGAGFIVSALISLFLTKRLGAWQQPAPDDLVK